MKKMILVGTAIAALAPAAAASATAVTVTDPTGGAFSGSYTYSCPTATNPSQTCQGTQTGYVQVNNNGAVACNGNPTTLNSPAGSGQGFVWVGSGNAASQPLQQDPTGNVGAGSDQTGTGASAQGQPCNENPSSTGVTP